jgi:hypothetical protein
MSLLSAGSALEGAFEDVVLGEPFGRIVMLS